MQPATEFMSIYRTANYSALTGVIVAQCLVYTALRAHPQHFKDNQTILQHRRQ